MPFTRLPGGGLGGGGLGGGGLCWFIIFSFSSSAMATAREAPPARALPTATAFPASPAAVAESSATKAADMGFTVTMIASADDCSRGSSV